MAAKEKSTQYLSLKTLFESGSVSKMRDIEDLFPTMVSKDLGMNHSRYIDKLHHPDLFSYGQTIKLASLIGIDPKIISNIILSELNFRVKKPAK